MATALEVSLDVALSSDAGLLANLLELYVHDLVIAVGALTLSRQ
jgi:hypothetical protein